MAISRQTAEYPVFSLAVLAGQARHGARASLLVAGGGGKVRSGVPNGVVKYDCAANSRGDTDASTTAPRGKRWLRFWRARAQVLPLVASSVRRAFDDVPLLVLTSSSPVAARGRERERACCCVCVGNECLIGSPAQVLGSGDDDGDGDGRVDACERVANMTLKFEPEEAQPDEERTLGMPTMPADTAHDGRARSTRRRRRDGTGGDDGGRHARRVHSSARFTHGAMNSGGSVVALGSESAHSVLLVFRRARIGRAGAASFVSDDEEDEEAAGSDEDDGCADGGSMVEVLPVRAEARIVDVALSPSGAWLAVSTVAERRDNERERANDDNGQAGGVHVYDAGACRRAAAARHRRHHGGDGDAYLDRVSLGDRVETAQRQHRHRGANRNDNGSDEEDTDDRDACTEIVAPTQRIAAFDASDVQPSVTHSAAREKCRRTRISSRRCLPHRWHTGPSAFLTDRVLLTTDVSPARGTACSIWHYHQQRAQWELWRTLARVSAEAITAMRVFGASDTDGYVAFGTVSGHVAVYMLNARSETGGLASSALLWHSAWRASSSWCWWWRLFGWRGGALHELPSASIVVDDGRDDAAETAEASAITRAVLYSASPDRSVVSVQLAPLVRATLRARALAWLTMTVAAAVWLAVVTAARTEATVMH